MRQTKKLNKESNIWEDIDFNKLVKGDVFRLFEPSGNPVVDNSGFSIFEAKSDAYLNAENIWQINILDCLTQELP